MDFENYEWYKAGNVTVQQGSREIVGTNTDWLMGNIKKGDVFVLDNAPYEIDEVIGSETLSLVNEYTGENAAGKNYSIIPRAKAVLLAELAHNLMQTVKNWNAREASYQEQFKNIENRTQIVDMLGLYIDDDGDLAQGEGERTSLLSIMSAPVATSAETQQMLDEVFSGSSDS